MRDVLHGEQVRRCGVVEGYRTVSPPIEDTIMLTMGTLDGVSATLLCVTHSSIWMMPHASLTLTHTLIAQVDSGFIIDADGRIQTLRHG